MAGGQLPAPMNAMHAQQPNAQPRVPAMRLPDWQPRLAQLVTQRMRSPLQWGVHDCCLWAADAVQAVTGTDLAAGLRGTYSTQAEAQARLLQLGGLAALCVDRLGPVARTALAQPGDIGLTTVQGVRALVVCGGGNFLGVGATGLVPVPSESVARVWRCTVEVRHG